MSGFPFGPPKESGTCALSVLRVQNHVDGIMYRQPTIRADVWNPKRVGIPAELTSLHSDLFPELYHSALEAGRIAYQEFSD